MKRKWPILTLVPAVLAGLLVLAAAGVAIAALAGVDFTRRLAPEVRRGLRAFDQEDYSKASEYLEKGRTDIPEEEGALWLDRGLALARLEKHQEASVALRRAAGASKTPPEVRSEAHLALGNLALTKHLDFEALEDFRQALRRWPENRDAAWNLSLARRRLQIDACKIVEPAKLQVTAGQESDEVTGEVVEAPRTGEEGALKGLRAELGVGLDGSDPREKGWQWNKVEYAGESQEGGGERYAGKIKLSDPGRYDYVFRFKQPGSEWQYCDVDGSNVGGFSSEQAGDLVVAPPGNRCQLLGPAWLITAPDTETDPVEVVLSIDEESELGEVELGYGPDGSEPDSEDWQWGATEQIEGSLEVAGSIPAGSPRYRGRLSIGDEGRFDYAVRMRPRGAEEWIHCDLNGSDDGYAAQGAGDVIVRNLPENGCLLDRPPRTQAAPGQPTEPIRALVHQEGEPLEPLRVEIGSGADGSQPGDEWTWTQAESAEDAPDGWAAFGVGITAPEEQGSYDFAVRVRRGGQSAPWVICDLDGSADGYETAMAGELLVQESDSNDEQDEQDEEEQDEEEQDEDEQDEDEQDEEEDEEEQQEEEEEEQLPQDMESVLDALQDNERTFLPPQSSRQPRQDW